MENIGAIFYDIRANSNIEERKLFWFYRADCKTAGFTLKRFNLKIVKETQFNATIYKKKKL